MGIYRDSHTVSAHSYYHFPYHYPSRYHYHYHSHCQEGDFRVHLNQITLMITKNSQKVNI